MQVKNLYPCIMRQLDVPCPTIVITYKTLKKPCFQGFSSSRDPSSRHLPIAARMVSTWFSNCGQALQASMCSRKATASFSLRSRSSLAITSAAASLQVRLKSVSFGINLKKHQCPRWPNQWMFRHSCKRNRARCSCTYKLVGVMASSLHTS